ncbi:AEC family transporter [uncultured Oscillibacter sp.]|uniref:AEC family transporter n=1 Tax=uncultured Oscillibacter sp. TaxID=876091 RepID=UPI0025CBB592|nr:AEC family transporter [uncultured Oscillibacter sp.]
MLQNLLFSVNTSLPLFILLGLGYVLTRKGMFSDDYVSRTTNLVYYVMLPAKLFLDMCQTDLSAAFDPKYVAVTAGGVMVQFALAWVCGDLLCRDKTKQSAFAHACFRGNFAYLGMALLQNIYGNSIASTAVILAIVLPLYNIQGVALLTVKEGEGGVHVGKILLGVLKNPMVLAILAGLPFAYFHVELPFVVTKSLSYLEVATSTMALLVVGASIKLDAIREDLGLLLRAAGIKLVIMPAIWGGMAVLAGLTTEQVVTLTVVGAMPSAVNVYIITDKLGGDGKTACGAVVVTHLVSIVTMTGVVFILRSAGLI